MDKQEQFTARHISLSVVNDFIRVFFLSLRQNTIVFTNLYQLLNWLQSITSISTDGVLFAKLAAYFILLLLLCRSKTGGCSGHASVLSCSQAGPVIHSLSSKSLICMPRVPISAELVVPWTCFPSSTVEVSRISASRFATNTVCLV